MIGYLEICLSFRFFIIRILLEAMLIDVEIEMDLLLLTATIHGVLRQNGKIVYNVRLLR